MSKDLDPEAFGKSIAKAVFKELEVYERKRLKKSKASWQAGVPVEVKGGKTEVAFEDTPEDVNKRLAEGFRIYSILQNPASLTGVTVVLEHYRKVGV